MSISTLVKKFFPSKKLSASQLICLSFVGVIIIGTLLLLLPFSTYESITFVEALFTATSATCVTGLVLMDTYLSFTFFGQLVILILIQVGGLGLVTLTSFFAIAVRRRMGFRDLRLMNESVFADGYSQSTMIVRVVVRLALTFEIIGALLLMVAFVPQFGVQGIWYSIFIAISAFCNAGFDLFGHIAPYASLTGFVSNYYVQTIVMILIMAGGLGFIVWLELAQWRKTRRLSLHSRVVVIFSLILWISGAILLIILEWSNPDTLGTLTFGDKIMAGVFQSVSARTAGFNTVDLAALEPISKLWMSVLMFIGAAPGGTGGGIKVTTIAVLVLTIRSVSQGRNDCIIHGRHVEHKTVYRALSITTMGVFAVFVATLFPYLNSTNISGVDAIFEAVSAFATVGLSVGVTGTLPLASQLIFIIAMFIGRVGPVSLAISLSARADESRAKILPKGQINVG